MGTTTQGLNAARPAGYARLAYGMAPTLAAVIGLFTLSIGCGQEPVPPAPVARPVKLLEVGTAGTDFRNEYPGQIRPATDAQVGFEVPGKLIEFPVKESQQVELGDVLARLDPRDFEADRDAAAAHAASAKADYSRAKILFDEHVISKQEREKAQRNHEVSVARVQRAQKAVEDTVLRAPFSGIVARKIVNDFDNVEAKQPVVQLQTGSALDIIVNLPEQDFGRIRTGLTIEERNTYLDVAVVVSALPGRSFPAKLKEFATTADPKTRTFAVTFSFEVPTDVNVMPGMTAKLVGSGGALDEPRRTVPVQAIAEDEGGQSYVWTVDPDSMRVTRTSVIPGELTGSSVEIRDGLQTGGLIVVSGVHQLREGMEVRRMAE
jgi:multidrug efflux system membrane fusion protein